MKMQKFGDFCVSASPPVFQILEGTRKKSRMAPASFLYMCNILCFPSTGVVVIFQDNILCHWLLRGCFGDFLNASPLG